jgi:hypothetical protein
MPTENEKTQFSHSGKPDGTFDTTCPLCGKVVGNAKTESELGSFEANHSCDPGDLLAKQISTEAQ